MADLKKAKMGHLFTGAVAEGMCPGGGDVLDYYFRAWATLVANHRNLPSLYS